MRSLLACTLFGTVLLTIATPAGPERVVRDPAACASWQRQYQNGCVVPSGRLVERDGPATHDAGRVLRAGCAAITQRKTAACAALPPES